jgi:hypothetical protein
VGRQKNKSVRRDRAVAAAMPAAFRTKDPFFVALDGERPGSESCPQRPPRQQQQQQQQSPVSDPSVRRCWRARAWGVDTVTTSTNSIMTTSSSSVSATAATWHSMFHGPTGEGGGGAAAPTAANEEDDPFSSSILVVSPPPEISRRTRFGYDGGSSSSSNNAVAAALSQLLAARPNHKHRSCGCPVSADGGTVATATSCVHHHHGCDCASSCPSLMAGAGAGAASSADAAALSSCAEQQRRRRSSSSSGADNNSHRLAASFDDLEQRIKRVRLSSTPGELCWARELRDLGSLPQGWRPAGPSSSSSHGHNPPHRPARGSDAVPSSLLNRSGAALLSPGGEPSWYEKVLSEIAGARVAPEDGREWIATTMECASCRMVLEPLAPHRLALHLQYSRTILRQSCWDEDENDICDKRRLTQSSAFPEIRVDVRIPRHYPHEPPLVSSVRYSPSPSHVGGLSSASIGSGSTSEAAMETIYPRRATSELWSSPRHSMLCQVDSIVIVPFDPDGNPGGDPELLQGNNDSSEGQQNRSSHEVKLKTSQRGDINDRTMDKSSGDAPDQEHMNRHAVPPAATMWNPECRRELKLHGYSPVHRLSDVLERIAAALYTASPSNTTLVVPTIGGSDDDDNSTGGSSVQNGSGFGRDRTVARSRHPGCSGSSGAAREGSVMMQTFPTHVSSSASADAASWLSSFVAAATMPAGMEADQATERHL